MQLVEVVLYVRDMERAIRFYRDTLGLELAFESEGWTTFGTAPARSRCTRPTSVSRAAASPTRRS